jgi:hypothetical protein
MNKLTSLTFGSLLASAVLGQQTELDAARARWEGVLQTLKDEPVDYNYAYAGSKDMYPQFQVLVRNGTQVSSYTPYEPPAAIALYTVESLFDEIQADIDSNATANVTYTYDETYGFPTFWVIDDDNNTASWAKMEQFTFFTVLKKDWIENIAPWNALAMDNYDYTVQVIGFMPSEYTSPKRIQVRNRSIVSILDVDTGNNVDLSFYDYPTVDDAFDNIGIALDTYFGAMRVTYDETLGYPSDYMLESDIFVADGAASVTISDVTFVDDSGNGGGIPDDAQALLDTNKALWESHNLEHYHFGIKKECYCIFNEPISVQVTNKQVTKMTTRFGDEVTVQDTFYSPVIEDIFDIIQNAITENYDQLVVTYDDEYGFPTFVTVNESLMIADLEYKLIIDYLAPVSDWQSDLDDAKSTWQSQSLDTYKYTYQRSCECTDDYTRPKLVEVVNGTIAAIDGSPVESIQRASVTTDIPTLDGLLEVIQDAINQNAFQINVEYDPKYAYPTSIFIDYDEMMADEELIVTAKLEIDDSKDPEGPNLPSAVAKTGILPCLALLSVALPWMV